jgi:hypothetical protein
MNSITTRSALRSQSRASNLPIQQVRHATLIKRPKRPYTFTQLITLSDGSTFTHRTTSPQAVYLTVKDTKNSPLWNPSSQKLLNVEEDDAGRLRKFRERFGRGFDAEAKEVIVDDEVCTLEHCVGTIRLEDAGLTRYHSQDPVDVAANAKKEPDEPVYSLMDLISDAGSQTKAPKGAAGGKKGGKK